jgi:phospholipase C
MTMHKVRVVAVFTTMSLAAVLITAATRPGTTPSARAAIPAFKHVVIIVMENRTPDNLFQGLCAPPFGAASSCSTSPGPGQYDIQTSNWLDKFAPGGVIQPKAVTLARTVDLDHSHGGWLRQCDLKSGTTNVCQMDGRSGCKACSADAQWNYVTYKNGILKPYLQLATQYGWANYMFQTNQGPSYPAHQFLFGGTSAPSAADDNAGIFVSENLVGTGGVGGFNKSAGCAAPETTRTFVISPGGKESTLFPCFEHQTLPDLFDASVTWRYYAPAPGTIWTAPNSIQHLCKATAQGGTCSGPVWNEHLDFESSDVLGDIARCNLRSVSWMIPAARYSDHAGLKSGNGGPAWVASIVNAIGNSTKCDNGKGYWDDTAIFITWDDWGGWYDHVAPTFLPKEQGDYQYGFRVPLLVVSAYTPKGYINNVHHDFGSIVRFVEHNFGIEEGALNFADRRSGSNLAAFFDLSKPPRPFTLIAVKANSLTAAMLDDTSPPDDD